MQLHIVVSDTPTPAEVTKALQVLLMISGIPTMQSAVKALGEVFAEETETDEADDENRGATPAAPPPPPPPVNAGAIAVERDATNLPWDARIHSSKKTKNKDGSWKAKKNVEPATVTAVEAELRALAGNTAPAAPPPPPPPAAAAAPPPPPPPAPAPVVAASDANTFVGVMQKISGGLTNGKLDQGKVSAALASVGLKQPLDLNAHPQQIPAVNAYLDAVMM